MFGLFKASMLHTAVEQELTAQLKDMGVKDRKWIKELCRSPGGYDVISHVSDNKYFVKDGADKKLLPFLTSVYLLNMTITYSTNLDLISQFNCAKLLNDRLRKARTNLSFWLQWEGFFNECEKNLEVWISENQSTIESML